MSEPIALGRTPSPSPPAQGQRMQGGGNALTAPISPSRRMPTVDRTRVDPQLRQAAEGMEAMFLDYLMKTMRQTVPQNEFDLESPATQIYRGMLDSEIAQKAVKSRGVGLADQIIAYLQTERYNQGQEQAAPEQRTGGTHEGESVDK